MEHCPNCGGELKIIAAILEVGPNTNGPEDRLCLAHARASVPWQPVIEKILTHLGLQARAPPRAPARRNCKRPDHLEPKPIRRSRCRGCGDRLRQGFAQTRFGATSSGKDQGKGYERHPSGLRSVFNGLRPRPRATRVRVRELGGGPPESG